MKYIDDKSGIYCERVNGKFLCVPFSAMKKDGFVEEKACPIEKCRQNADDFEFLTDEVFPGDTGEEVRLSTEEYCRRISEHGL